VRLSQLHNLGSLDFSYSCVSSLNWSVVEVGTGIICASIPSLKPLIVRVFPGKFFTVPRGSNRWPSRNDRSGTQTTEQESYVVEMGSYRRANAGLQKGGLGLKTQVLRSMSTKSMSTHGSGEERLVSANPHDNMSRSMAGHAPGRADEIR
jgi:hypothetical protein